MSRRWKSILIAAAVLLGPTVLGAAWVGLSISRRWAETLKRTEEIAIELAAPIVYAPLPHEQTLPGNAWDDYVSAAKAADGAVDPNNEDLLMFVRRQSGSRQSAAENSLRLLEPALARLRVGARRATFQLREDPRTNLSMRSLALAVRARARLDAASGRAAEAFHQLVELVRIGQHLTQASASEGAEISEAGLEELVDILKLHRPIRSELETLLQALPTLEEGNPEPGRWLLECREYMLQRGIAGGRVDPATPRIRPDWRHAWSLRLYLASTADRVESWARTLQALKNRPWPETNKFIAEAEISGNALLRWAARGATEEMRHWTLRTRLQLIRAALLFRMSGEKADLPDPFGGTLQWDGEGVRSRGPADDPDDDIVLRIR